VSYYDFDRPAAVGLPRDAFRPSPIFLVVLAFFALSGVLLWTAVGNARFNVFLFILAGWIVSLCLHEYAHAMFAYRFGDHGVAIRGYLRLDPLKYANPVFSIVIPVLFMLLGGIALPGGAVLVDNARLRTRGRQAMVSLAGPITNAVFAILLMIPFLAGVGNPFDAAVLTLDAFNNAHGVFWSAVALLAFFQLMAAILNLLPVPGLDGGNAIYPYLDNDWKRAFNTVRPYGIFVIFLLFYTVLGAWFRDFINAIMGVFNVPDGLWNLGLAFFQFWRR
jgi:Zn-dependent protease